MSIGKIFPLFVVMLFITASLSYGANGEPYEIAPDFTLPDQNGDPVTLSKVLEDHRGAVVVFYPKDDTKGWTIEFVEFQQNIGQFESRNIKVLGISVDSKESHQKFIAKNALNSITLLVDSDGKTAKAYNSFHMDYKVANRGYFIVDKNRVVVFKHMKGLSLLENQTKTLIDSIDKHMTTSQLGRLKAEDH